MDPTKKMYLLASDGMEWEDIAIYILADGEAIEVSKKYYKCRLELLAQLKTDRYEPTYSYYQNGILYCGQTSTETVP